MAYAWFVYDIREVPSLYHINQVHQNAIFEYGMAQDSSQELLWLSKNMIISHGTPLIFDEHVLLCESM